MAILLRQSRMSSDFPFSNNAAKRHTKSNFTTYTGLPLLICQEKIMKHLLIPLISLSLLPSLTNASKCDAVFADGSNDVYVLSSTSTVSSDAKKWFCSDAFVETTRKSAGSGGITLPVEGVMLTFGTESETDASYKARKQFCASQAASFDTKDSIFLAKKVASATKVNAWLACHRLNVENAGSVSFTQETVSKGKMIVITAKWNHVNAAPPPVVYELNTIGATCNNVIAAGTELTVEGLTDICKREGDSQVSLVLTTSAGHKTIELAEINCGKMYGKIETVETVATPKWVSDGEKCTTIGTGNHHCKHNCEGEPTRTNYKIDVTVEDGFKLTNPRLNCIAGPCGGWNQVHYATNDGDKRVHGSFDVWSKPTSWRLCADKQKQIYESREVRSAPVSVTYGQNFTVTASKKASGQLMIVTNKLGQSTTYTLGSDPFGTPIRKISQAEDASKFHYTYQVACQ